MSSFTNKHKNTRPNLDGISDLKPKVKTTLIRQREEAEAAAKAKKKAAKKTAKSD